MLSLGNVQTSSAIKKSNLPKRDKAAISTEATVQLNDWGIAQETPLLTGSLTYVKAFPGSQWWTRFNDPHLNALIEKALSQNPDLLATETRIQAAKGVMKQATSGLLPSIRFEPSHLTQQYSRGQFLFPITERTFRSYQLPINVSYEADIWGKSFLALQGTKAIRHGAQSAYQSAAVQLTSSVAASYFNVLKFDALLSQQAVLVRFGQQLLDHWEHLLQHGVIAADQVESFRQQLAAAKGEQEQLESARGIVARQLALLTGESPASASSLTVGKLEQLALPQCVNTGVPAELVMRRPDVQQVESELKVAALEFRASKRDFLPSLSVTASSGLNAIGFDQLFKWYSFSSFVMPVLSQPIFEGGKLIGQYQVKKADYQQWIHRYKSTLLAAFGDVENALTQVGGDQDAYHQLQSQLTSAEAKVYHEKRRADEGLSNEPQWLPLEIERVSLQKALAQQKTQLLIDHVSLIKALGGGYNALGPTAVKPNG